jgi:hypothetical protein
MRILRVRHFPHAKYHDHDRTVTWAAPRRLSVIWHNATTFTYAWASIRTWPIARIVTGTCRAGRRRPRSVACCQLLDRCTSNRTYNSHGLTPCSPLILTRRYLGTKHKAVCFSDARLALEKHLHLKHDLDLVTRHREAAEDE